MAASRINQLQKVRSIGRTAGVAIATLIFAIFSSSTALSAEEFEFNEGLARVDHAIRTNPSHVSAPALESCRNRRNNAVRLYSGRQTSRAKRSLRYCFDVLKIAAVAPEATQVDTGPTLEELQARSAREVEMALKLEPNIEDGLEIYRTCALCHEPEGWGLATGAVPQIAGQHRTVVIKQLADIRAGNRDTVLMAPYATVEVIGGAQSIADVAGYIDTLEISVANHKGSGEDLERGEKLYGEQCARCHGASGEGNSDEYVPRIQSQHYSYLVRQFDWIKTGRRRNGSAEMIEQIQGMSESDRNAILDYVSRLEPAPELQAPPGWHNPDFIQRVRK
jgi:cytochrome c553